MANVRGSTRRIGPDRPPSPNPIVQDFVPSSGWTEDSNGHYLLVDLPDFKKEEVKLQQETSGHVIISGERLTSDKRYILRFQQTLTMPPDSDIDRISAKFDGGILYVTVAKHAPVQPQQETEIRRESENEDTKSNNAAEENGRQETEREEDENDHQKKNSEVDSFAEETIRKWETESNNQLMVRATRILKENKQIVFTALFAFSLGLWVSRKLGSGEHADGSPI